MLEVLTASINAMSALLLLYMSANSQNSPSEMCLKTHNVTRQEFKKW